MYSQLNDLVAGDKIRVIKEFKDFDGKAIPVDSIWTFKEYSYFPYDGGYTLYFDEGTMRMAEISESDYYVFSHAHEYFVLLPAVPKDTWTSHR